MRLACASLACMGAWIVCGHAHAYSELSRFGEPVDDGGGGGRWFTGSPTDGYHCDVCHTGAKAFPINVQVPDRYEPGVTYDVLVTWLDVVPHISALAEFTDEEGRGAGSVRLPGGNAMTEYDACEPYAAKIPAGEMFEASDGRSVVGLADCGGRQLHFQWTAPATDVGPVLFSGGVVQSDNMNDIQGDAVGLLNHVVLGPRTGAYTTQTQGSCNVAGVSPARESRGMGAGWVIGAAIPVLIRRRRRRAWRNAGCR